MRFSKIKLNDIANGVGITLSLWTQGCPHKCKGCFNRETWDFSGGMEFTKADEDYIINIINADNVKRDLSILGGEPLCPQNIEGVINLCKRFKKEYPNKKIYIWTGYRIEDLDKTQSEILEYIDFLIDGKFEIDKKDISLFMKGSHNQRILVSGKDFNLEPF